MTPQRQPACAKSRTALCLSRKSVPSSASTVNSSTTRKVCFTTVPQMRTDNDTCPTTFIGSPLAPTVDTAACSIRCKVDSGSLSRWISETATPESRRNWNCRAPIVPPIRKLNLPLGLLVVLVCGYFISSHASRWAPSGLAHCRLIDSFAGSVPLAHTGNTRCGDEPSGCCWSFFLKVVPCLLLAGFPAFPSE